MDVAALVITLVEKALSYSKLPDWVQALAVRELKACLTEEAVATLSYHVKTWLISELQALDEKAPGGLLKDAIEALVVALSPQSP